MAVVIRSFRSLIEVIAASCLASRALAQDPITRVSVDSNGQQANDSSYESDLSTDGRVAGFFSYADDLVSGDTNGVPDVFVRDGVTGMTELVSIDSSGVQGNSESYGPALSSDGQIVAFTSFASNLVSGDTNRAADVFVHDRSTKNTLRVSVKSDGTQSSKESRGAAISGDGQVIVFWTDAQLVPSDTNQYSDVYVYDFNIGTVERISVDSNGGDGDADSYVSGKCSSDGHLVAFVSNATNLVPGDTNGAEDVFVRDRTRAAIERVSVDSSGNQGNGPSEYGSITADGRFVAFASFATNLAPGDSNGFVDVFVHDRSNGVTERVSVDSSGGQGNGASGSYGVAISNDGRIVSFETYADNLYAGDTNKATDVFVHDRGTGLTQIMSADCVGSVGGTDSWNSTVSADGSHVAFTSAATNLIDGDTNAAVDIFDHDRSKDIHASWSNYGQGYPGTNGIPTLTASANPVFGTTLSIDASNSLGAPTFGLMLVGLSSASIQTSAGGTILVNPVLIEPLVIGPSGASNSLFIYQDESLCGVSAFLQVLELDPGAAKRISFTPGLQLILGV